jgi:transcriptional regulator with GAF, ATPase, and Fis domain
LATLNITRVDGSAFAVPVYKSLTTIGADKDSDVVLELTGSARLAATIAFDGTTYTIASADKRTEIEVSGRPVRKQTLVDGDIVRIAGVTLSFATDEEPRVPVKTESAGDREMDAYRRLLAFSETLGGEKSITALLDRVMDEIVAVTRADKGFLVLLEGDAPQVRVARNLRGESLEQAVAELSDTILAKVFREKRPIVVSNALHDTEFNSSISVINLRLTSVMCAPLMHQGEVFGAIYVGNNSVVNLFDEKSLELLTVFSAQASLLVQNALHVDALEKRADKLEEALEDKRYGDIIGSCDGMKEIFKRIDKIAKTDISVFITGETGTGKELIAREVHRRSPRAKGPLVVINCGAIPENLLESELFGHVRGAFTGAVQTRPGRFQLASGGTLFLDEIGEMPMHLQVKILRAIQEKQVTKVGDGKAENVDIRVLAATHRNLEEMVKKGEFREDLYYRLNVVGVHLPPLRDRGEDVVVIANFLMKKYADEFEVKVKGLSPKALTAIRRYTWPGNVRQLENRLKRAIVLCEGGRIEPSDLDITDEDLEDILPLADALERFRRRYINEALERNSGNRTKTAKELGVDPRTIFRHLEAERDPEEEALS